MYTTREAFKRWYGASRAMSRRHDKFVSDFREIRFRSGFDLAPELNGLRRHGYSPAFIRSETAIDHAEISKSRGTLGLHIGKRWYRRTIQAIRERRPYAAPLP